MTTSKQFDWGKHIELMEQKIAYNKLVKQVKAAHIIQSYWRLKYMSWLIYKKVGVKRIKKYMDWIDIWGFIIRCFKYRRYEKAHFFSGWFNGFLETHIDFEIYCNEGK